MEIKINDNVYYNSFKSKKELRTIILRMIFESKADRILYKGDPSEINYKLLKKLILPKGIIKNTNVDPIDIKNTYSELISSCGEEPYCMIYKK